MKKEFTHKRQASSRKNWKWSLTAALTITLVICCSAGFYVFHNKKLPFNSTHMVAYVEKIQAWIAERKNHLHKGIVKVKRLAANKNEAEPQIHYEFYTVLQNMKIPVPDAAGAVPDTKPAAREITSIADPDELEKEISKELKEKDKKHHRLG